MCDFSLVESTSCFNKRIKYLLDLTNLLEWILYTTTIMFVVPFLTTVTPSWQWKAGAAAVFLAWFDCLLFLRRFDFFGIYVVMFLEILKTLLQVICVFSILLIAFAMAFFMLMNQESSGAHSTVGMSLLRTAMMMLELDFMNSFNEPFTDDDPETLYFGGTVVVLLVTFVLLMPILLMNLLIGLAVGDINSVQQQATLKRLAMQVSLHTDLEGKLPIRLVDMVDKMADKYYPNRCAGLIEKIHLQFWSKLSFGGESFDYDGNIAMKHQQHMFEELFKQKKRMKDLSRNVQKQYDLLRLIVQKMEIHTEDENLDEGVDGKAVKQPMKLNTWSSVVRRHLIRKSAAVSAWKSTTEKDI